MPRQPSDEGLDEIDRILLRLLSKNPRMPYTSIADRLEETGHEMSSEGVRHRVRKLLELTSAFFLLAPEKHDWQILRVGVILEDTPDVMPDVRSFLSNHGFWLVCNGMGTIDIYAVATATSVEEIHTILMNVRSHSSIESVDFSIETKRETNLENYFSHNSTANGPDG